MKSKRPVYLNLFQFSWPFAALASITHRITGALLFFALLALLYLLDLGLSSPAGFEQAKAYLAAPLSKIALLLLLAALTYHLIAGLKHMLLDFHIGDTVVAAKIESMVVFVLTGVVVVGLGAWIW